MSGPIRVSVCPPGDPSSPMGNLAPKLWLLTSAWPTEYPGNVAVLLSVLSTQHSRYDLSVTARDWSWAACTGCWLPNSLTHFVTVSLRGNCQKSKFDSKFEVDNDERGYVSYRGETGTKVSYDPADRQWVMVVVNKPSVRAVSNSSMASLVMGLHWWTVYNDLECVPTQTELILSLTTCSDQQFTCNNGLCIHILDRCNRRPDCLDKSDEFDCKTISRNPDYQHNIAPPPQHLQEKINIDVTMDIISILDIAERHSMFQVQFFLHLTWHDSRLQFHDLKQDPGLNSLSREEKLQIWIPVISFVNTEDRPSTLVDEDTSITVAKQGNFSLAHLSEVEHHQIFKGSENSLTMTRFYNIRFLCHYEMQWYPFDTQSCEMRLDFRGKTFDFARLQPRLLNFLGVTDVKEYIVRQHNMTEHRTGVSVHILLGRRLLTICLTTIVPAVLLNVISFTTNYFKAFFFEAIVTVNLTALLVLTTLFISVRIEIKIIAIKSNSTF